MAIARGYIESPNSNTRSVRNATHVASQVAHSATLRFSAIGPGWLLLFVVRDHAAIQEVDHLPETSDFTAVELE